MIVRGGGTDRTVIRCALSDLLFADLTVAVVFCYAQRLDEARLATGLARALRRLPPFAGRLRHGAAGLEIVCEDAGAELTVAEAGETLPEALGWMTLPDCGFVDHVDARAARAGTAPLLRVRISRLAGGGTALGCSWHHAVGDMSSFMTLMRTWSMLATDTDATLESPLEALPEFLPDSLPGTDASDREVLVDRETLLDRVLPERDSGRPGFRVVDAAEAAELARAVETATRANRTVQIYFGEPETARLRARLGAQAGRRLSTNDVLTAHVVSTARRLDGDGAARFLTIPVDLRRLLGLPADALGNLLGEIHLRCAAGDVDALADPADAAVTGRTAALAADIRDAVDGLAPGQLSLRTNRELLKVLGPDRLGDCVALGFDPPRRTFTSSSWRGFGVYDVVFDGVRPVCVCPANGLPLPWVCWFVEGFEGVGTLCTLSVPAALAKRLRSSAGRAALHWCRDPGDTLPEIAIGVRKLL